MNVLFLCFSTVGGAHR